MLFAFKDCRLQPPTVCVCDSLSLNTQHLLSGLSLVVIQTPDFPAPSWVYDNRTTPLTQSKLILLLDSSPSSRGPGSSQEQQAPLTPCLYPQHAGTSPLSPAVDAQDWSIQVPEGYSAPLPSSQPLIRMYFLNSCLDFHVSIALPYFTLSWGWAWDFCISKSEEWFRPEVEGCKHQSPGLACVCSAPWLSPEGRFSFCRVRFKRIHKKFKIPIPYSTTFHHTRGAKAFTLKKQQFTFFPSSTKYSVLYCFSYETQALLNNKSYPQKASSSGSHPALHSPVIPPSSTCFKMLFSLLMTDYSNQEQIK